MKGIKKLVIFFLFGIMLTFSVHAPLCESIDPTDSEVIIKTSANNQYVIHNYTQAVVICCEEKQQYFCGMYMSFLFQSFKTNGGNTF